MATDDASLLYMEQLLSMSQVSAMEDTDYSSKIP